MQAKEYVAQVKLMFAYRFEPDKINITPKINLNFWLKSIFNWLISNGIK